MYDLQLIEERIMTIAKSKGLSKNKLLINAKLHKGVFDNMKKGQVPSIDKIHTIADYLECSVDYLLGRTDEQTITHSTSNINSNFVQGNGSVSVTGSILGSGSISTTIPTKQSEEQSTELSSEEIEILDIYRSLNVRNKNKFLNFILDIEKEN